MSSRTWAERVLWLLTVVFLLVGGLWAYSRIDEVPERPDYGLFLEKADLPALQGKLSGAQAELQEERSRLDQAQAVRAEAESEYLFRREEYRTAVEAGTAAPALKETFEEARSTYEAAKTREAEAQSAVSAAEEDAQELRQRVSQEEQNARAAFNRADRRYQAVAAGLRLAYLLAAFAVSLYLWRFLVGRGSRFHELGLAFVVFAAIQMAVMAGDYAWHYLSEYAPLLISIAGVGGTVGATVAVKRYLLAPGRLGKFRVRHDSCPNCGRNLAHSGDHCVECGRPLKELCTRCGENHLVFGPYCPVTGQPLTSEEDSEGGVTDAAGSAGDQ